MFLPKYVHSNGLKLSSALEKLSSTSQCLGLKNAKKKKKLKKLSVLNAVLIELKFM